MLTDPFGLFLYETVTEPADAGGAGDISSEAAAGAVDASDATEGAANVVPEAPATPAPAPEYLTAEQAAAVAQQQFVALLEQAASYRESGVQQGPPPIDPFADDFADQLAARDQWLVEQMGRSFEERFGQIEPVIETQMESQGRQIMDDSFAQWEADPQIGKFDHKAAELASYGFLQETNGDPHAALRKGAEWAAQHDKQIAEKAVEAYKQSLTADGSTLLDPDVRGSGLAREGAYQSEEEAGLAFLARTNV